MYQVTFLAAGVELIGQFNLTCVRGEEFAQGISHIAALKGFQVGSDKVDILGLCSCHPCTVRQDLPLALEQNGEAFR
jgi:hypothetical protein